MKRVLLCVLALLAFAAPAAAQPSPVQPAPVKRTVLGKVEVPGANYDVVTAMVEIVPGFKAGRHNHPGEEIAYVIEGTLEYEIEGRPPVTLKAGDVLFLPAGTIHAARNVGTVNAAELATYIVEKGKPLVQMVK